MNSDFFMQKAIELSIKNIHNNGGPFGCVIVKNNKIISEGVNGVTQNKGCKGECRGKKIR